MLTPMKTEEKDKSDQTLDGIRQKQALPCNVPSMVKCSVGASEAFDGLSLRYLDVCPQCL